MSLNGASIVRIYCILFIHNFKSEDKLCLLINRNYNTWNLIWLEYHATCTNIAFIAILLAGRRISYYLSTYSVDTWIGTSEGLHNKDLVQSPIQFA